MVWSPPSFGLYFGGPPLLLACLLLSLLTDNLAICKQGAVFYLPPPCYNFSINRPPKYNFRSWLFVRAPPTIFLKKGNPLPSNKNCVPLTFPRIFESALKISICPQRFDTLLKEFTGVKTPKVTQRCRFSKFRPAV